MASTVNGQKPPVDYFSHSTPRPQPRPSFIGKFSKYSLIDINNQLTFSLKQNNAISPSLVWDSSPYNDPALISSDSCDEFLPSPTSPESLIFPLSSDNAYSLPKPSLSLSPRVKPDPSEAFNFGTFEDWMRWDDPSDHISSPTDSFFPELKIEPMSPNMNGLELHGGVNSSSIHLNSGLHPSAVTNGDDAAVFGEDPINEEPLFQTPNSLIPPAMMRDGIPPQENLYSMPPLWSRPIAGAGSRGRDSYTNALTPSQESRLRSIAMPSQPQTQIQIQQYPASPSSVRSSSPEPTEQQSRSNPPSSNNRRKRKSSIEDDFDFDGEDSPPPAAGRQFNPPVKKTAHNMIEKRYRTNLNEKIAALRDSVPSLRVMTKKNSRAGDGGQAEDLQGLTPAHKLNKATVLSKASEYIGHLEKRNKYLTKENASLKSRIEAFEILVMSRQAQNQGQSPSGISKRSQNGRHQNTGRYGSASALDGMMG